VNGSAIPDVNFDIGESYAGLLPISSKANETSELYFWFVPSENPAACDEILIWLNGGVCGEPFKSSYQFRIKLIKYSLAAHPLKVSCKRMAPSNGNMGRMRLSRIHGPGRTLPMLFGLSNL
jgi:Serine carboxypeptidase